jgi:ABC-type thiamine transport system substrate-binding protein
LTVYSAQGYDSDVTKAFQQQIGITTKLVDDSTGPLLVKIAAEGNNSQWDVAWFDGNVSMQTLAEQFVNWVLSPAGQSVMTHHDPTDGDTYFIPVVQGVTNTVDRQYTGVNFIDLDVSKWAGVESEYKYWFHTNIVQ